MKKFLIIIIICIGTYALVSRFTDFFPIRSINALLPVAKTTLSTSDKALKNAFENKINGLQVEGSGKVIKILTDDIQGSRHQRFILKLDSGQTLLIAHNIDLASRIERLKVGDQVNFNGQYEWNSKGGVIHWTHHDPNGQHEGGWLIHDKKIYQ